MSKRAAIWVGVVSILVIGLLGIRFFYSLENTWICENAEWIKHGNPLSPKPEEFCFDDDINGIDMRNVMAVKIFLSDSSFAGEPNFDCGRTVAVDRLVPKALGVARGSLEALIQGATQGEIDAGLVSNINSGAQIQRLTIEDGVVMVDFNEQLGFQVGGSCMVTAIRAQITDTLKQFPTVDRVVISINGRTEDILQP